MTANCKVYLIRHGRIQRDAEQRMYIGQLDIPLNEEGIKQAYYLQKRFEQMDINSVYCSDLSRAQQTAEIIVARKDMPVIPLKTLREINLGEWEGYSFADISQRFPSEFKERGADIGYYRVPGGESFADCSRRVIATFHQILENAFGNVLIVAHAGVNRLLLCYVLGIPLANLFRLTQDDGCVNVISFSKTGYQVKLINYPTPTK